MRWIKSLFEFEGNGVALDVAESIMLVTSRFLKGDKICMIDWWFHYCHFDQFYGFKSSGRVWKFKKFWRVFHFVLPIHISKDFRHSEISASLRRLLKRTYNFSNIFVLLTTTSSPENDSNSVHTHPAQIMHTI